MARILAALVFLIVVTGCTAKWAEFESAEGKFSAQFPGKPKMEAKKQATAMGSITLYFHTVEGPKGLYGVGYADFPATYIDRARADPDALKAMLEEAADGMVRRTGLTPDAPGRAITLRSYPGREVNASGRIQNRDATLKARLYLVENRLFQLIAVGEKDGLKKDDIDLFFYSFRLH